MKICIRIDRIRLYVQYNRYVHVIVIVCMNVFVVNTHRPGRITLLCLKRYVLYSACAISKYCMYEYGVLYCM